MIIKEIEEVGNRTCRFILVPKKTELGYQFSFDELASDQHILRHTFVDWTDKGTNFGLSEEGKIGLRQRDDDI